MQPYQSRNVDLSEGLQFCSRSELLRRLQTLVAEVTDITGQITRDQLRAKAEMQQSGVNGDWRDYADMSHYQRKCNALSWKKQQLQKVELQLAILKTTKEAEFAQRFVESARGTLPDEVFQGIVEGMVA